MADKAKLVKLVPSLADRRVLVVGDVFLDEYLVGRATRLSREAPIPVLEFARRFTVPGGAANPAHNVVALGGVARQVGVVGDDEAGHALRVELVQAGIDVEGLVADASRPTTTKTRIVAEGSLRFPQQLARIDRVERRPIAGAVEREVIARLEALAPQADALLVSDYRSGVVSETVVTTVRRLASRHRKLLTVDSQGNLPKFHGFDVVKCNHAEAQAVLGRELTTEDDFRRAGEQLLREISAGAVTITRGPDGMSVVGRAAGYAHLPAANRSEVFDVTGAGDTVIAVLTLALAAGVDLLAAAHLANYAAGLVVRKLGNATPSPEELAWAIERW